MSIEVASASVPMIPALSPDALEAHPTLSAAASLFAPAGCVPALAGAPHRKF